jgi:dipeptidyl aminopeptidase/acylaminoacyl peptidase
MSADGGYPTSLTQGGKFAHPAVYSPDGKWLVFDADGLWIIPTFGGQARQLTFKPTDYWTLDLSWSPASQFSLDECVSYPRWSPDGQWILYTVEHDGPTALCIVSPDGRTNIELYRHEGKIVSREWSPDSRKILFVTRNYGAREGGVFLLDVNSREVQQIAEEREHIYLDPVARWTTDGKQIVLRSNRSGFSKLWLLTASDGKLAPLTHGNQDDTTFIVGHDGWIVYSAHIEDTGCYEIWRIRQEGGTPERITIHPGVNVPVAVGSDGRIFYFHSDPSAQGDLWVIEKSGAHPKRLTCTDRVGFDNLISPPESVILPNIKDRRLYAQIYRPPDFDPSQKYPSIVWIKGGPTGRLQFSYSPIYSYLASQGFVVGTVSYRGCTGFGLNHTWADREDGVGVSDLADVLALTDYMRSLPEVLPTKVGVGGRSWGGYLTLRCVTQSPERFACGVAHSAIYDWPKQQELENVRFYSYWLFGGYAYEKPEIFKDRSPGSGLGQVRIPLLVTHGMVDYWTVFEQQVEPALERARAAGANIESRFYSKEGHGNILMENRRDYLERTLRFFNKHLKPWDFRENPRGTQGQAG